MDTRRDVATSTTWTGWVGFAAVMLILIGSITFFEGLVAVIREEYYVVTGQQVIVFDLTTWGWLMMIGAAGSVSPSATLESAEAPPVLIARTR